MPVFLVSSILKSDNGHGGFNIEPVPNTDIVVHWQSGGGSPLPDTRGRTDTSGVARISTPENYMQIGLPTGADGIIHATNGSLRGQASVKVDWLGNTKPERVAVVMAGDTEGNLKDIGNRITSGIKQSALLAIGLTFGIGFAILGVRGLIRK